MNREMPHLRYTERRIPNLTFKIKSEDEAIRGLPPHRHDFFEILFFISGGCEHKIGERVYQVRPGSIYFIAPYTVHQISVPKDARLFTIFFDIKFLRPHLKADSLDLGQVDLTQFPEFVPFALQKHFDFLLDEENVSYLTRLCQKMKDEQLSCRMFSVDLVRSYLFLLIGRIVHLHEREMLKLLRTGVNQIGHREKVSKILDHIRDNLSQKISLKDVAKRVFLSPNYVSHLIRRETGRSFTELVTERRVEVATELLCHTSLRVSEVASRVGFDDEAYFARRFRKLKGVSPRHYRDDWARKDLKNPV
jgi:AraC-like DNA-binding protein